MKPTKLILIILLGLFLTGQSQCPSGGSTPAPSFDSPEAAEDAKAAAAESPASNEAETLAADTPPWSPSTAGSIACSLATITVRVVLADEKPITKELLSFEIRARTSRHITYQDLAAHDLKIKEIRYRADTEIIPGDRLSGQKSILSHPTRWTVYIDLISSDENDNESCESRWVSMLAKDFFLKGVYQGEGSFYVNEVEDLKFTRDKEVWVGPLVDPFILEILTVH